MSILNRKPYAQQVIESISQVDLEKLQKEINGASATIFRSYLNTGKPFTTDDKGINHCVFETRNRIFTGYLVYNDKYCVLFAYNNTQYMPIVKINYANDEYEVVDESLSISEFRQIIVNADLKKIETTDITDMTDEQLDLLKCGDIVVKITDEGAHILRHAYVVSFKEDSAGICLTYADASVVETVSYDYIEGHWVYNSTDKGTI